jgi:tetratricopeptide (TPR) repeat protein
VLQIVPFPIWVAERYLYIPAIGLFVLGSRLFFWIGDRLGARAMRLGWEAAMGAVLLAFAWQTHAHLPVWKNDLVLWEATAKTCPTSPYCHANFGLALLQRGETERGVKELIQSVEIRPVPRYLIYLGDAYTMSLADYRQALIAYNMALQEGGSSLGADFYAKLARAYIKSGNLELAQRAIDAGSQVDRNEPTLLVINGFLQWKLGNFPLALNSLRKALRTTGQTSNPSGFLYHYWGDAAEVGRLIADLRSKPASGPTATKPVSEK